MNNYMAYDSDNFIPEVVKIWVARLNFSVMVPTWEPLQVEINTSVIRNSNFYNISMYRFASFNKSEVVKYCNNLNVEIKKQQDSNVESIKELYKLKLPPYHRIMA